MRNNFLIVSTGRTATKWLANIMNRGDITVLHEPRGWTDDTFDKAKYAFYQHQSYGEVNGALRYSLLDFDEIKKGIIVREPKSLVVSFSNRRSTKDLIKKIIDINTDYEIFDKYFSMGIPVFHYERMVSDIDYLQNLLNTYGVNYTCTNDDLQTKINTNKQVRYKHFDELPEACKIVFNAMNWNFNFLK